MEARNILTENGGKTISDKSYVSQLSRKWGQLLEGTDGVRNPYTKGVAAILLENQATYMKNLSEDALSTNVGSFTKYIFPVLRRVFPNLIANQITSVQPLSAPVGAVFTWDYKYEGRKGAKIPANGIVDYPYSQGYDGELSAGDALIRNFAKNYASEYVDYDVLCTDTGAATGTLNQGAGNCRIPAWKPIRTPGTSGQRTFSVKIYYRTVEAGSENKVATLDQTGGSTTLTDNHGNAVGTFIASTGAWALTPKTAGGAGCNFSANHVVYAQYYVNWELVNTTSGAAVPGISMDMAMSTVTAEPYKLRASWSQEAMDDLRALHGLNMEAELVAGLSNEIALEIDRKVITDLVAGAAHQATYSYSPTVPGEIESIRALLTQIDAVAAKIHKTTLRAPANFIVASPAVVSLLGQLTSHHDFDNGASQIVPPSYGPLTSDYGIQMVGTMMRKFTVYQDPFLDDNKVLVGLRGSNFLDAGYVFAPYIPLQVTPTWQDPHTFTFKKGFASRFATKLLRPEYYGVVTVSGLPSVTSSF
jgi:hypothetical protein